jgi:hypothetical protein
MFGLFTLATTVTASFTPLFTVRFLAGMSFGAALPIIVAVAAEVTTPERRALTAAMMFCGLPVGGALSAFTTQALPQPIDWRILFYIGGIIPILLVPVLWTLLPETYKPGSRAGVDKVGTWEALFGRKINNAEHQLAFIEMLRLITDGRISPEEAVRAYHGVLQGKGIKPQRALDEDLKLTDQTMSYDGSAARRATVEVKNNPLVLNRGAKVTGERSNSDWPKRADGSPDFTGMTAAQRLAYDQARLQRKFG